MPIEFHCQHCGKSIKAPDGSGGKRGECPSCKNSVYVPTPSDELEDIPLAPIDEDAERRNREREKQARKVQEALLHERKAAEGRDTDTAAPRPATPRAPAAPTRDVRKTVLMCVRALADSKLEQSEELIAELKLQSPDARKFIQALTVDSLQPKVLADIPPKLYHGFLKSIESQISE